MKTFRIVENGFLKHFPVISADYYEVKDGDLVFHELGGDFEPECARVLKGTWIGVVEIYLTSGVIEEEVEDEHVPGEAGEASCA